MHQIRIPTLQEQLELVKQGYAVKKINPENNLITFKYHRNVMYNYLWDKIPGILECRGHTYDMITEKIVTLPFRKTFNYLENDTWKNVPLDTKVSMYKKFNGFMAAVSLRNVNGKLELVISTTGTTNSDYVDIAKRHLIPMLQDKVLYSNKTYLFEIVDLSDPHIVNEPSGAHFLGSRCHNTGVFSPYHIGVNRMEMQLGEALEFVKTNLGEGFMLYDEQGNCCKLKTPYYVGKKKIMRAGPKLVQKIFEGEVDMLPVEWHNPVNQMIRDEWPSSFNMIDAQARRLILEKYWS